MSFTFPAFLFALSAIAIPIIIHLFNLRKFKTVYFSNVRFLKEVKEETQAKSKIKHLLVLTARILTIIFLVFAFAQPFIPSSNHNIALGEKAISIFIDNSFSMEAVSKNGTLLDEAKKRAIEITAAYKATDRFQLLTNDFEGKHQRLVNKEEFIELLDEVTISPATRNLSEIATRQSDVLLASDSKNKISFILSDFQKSILNLDKFKNDSNTLFNLIPLKASKKSNVFIDTCWFESPVRQYNQIEKLHVRIRNVSENIIENNSIKLSINGIQKTPASYSVDKDSETEIVLSFASKEVGVQHCKIELNDFPVTFDDTFYFSFEVAKNIPLLCINGADLNSESTYLNKLFSADSLFIYSKVQENKLDYSSLGNYKLIVLNELKSISSGLGQELKRFMNNGGSILVFPNQVADLNTYKDFFLSAKANYYERLDTTNTKVDKINLEHVIYKDVFDKKTLSASNLNLPKINEYFILSKNTRTNEEYLLKTQNGNILLSKYDVEKGKLYISTVGASDQFSNFAKHAIFVPTLYKIAMYSQVSQPLFYTISKDEIIEGKSVISGENVFHIKSTSGKFDIIPEHKVLDSKTVIFVHNQIKEANNYNLFANTELIQGISFNFNRTESDLSCYNETELKEELSKYNIFNVNVLELDIKNNYTSLKEMDQSRKLWKLCVIIALLFLAVEVILLRFVK
jgi:hypothetical protein